MRSIVKITAFCLFVLPISMGAIYIDDPASGTLPAGTQQPAGTVTLGGYTATDQVTGSFTNYGPGFYHSGSYFCDEYWKDYDFDDNSWGAANSFDLSSSSTGGHWSVSAIHRDENGNFKNGAANGGTMSPL